MRLQSYLSHCGVASRRAAEKIIADGRVSVNGEVVVEAGAKVSSARDKVSLDGKPLALETRMRYVLLNKPAGYVCSSADEKGRAVAAEILAPHYSERLYSVGRLDMYSSGLVIFTNDGGFAARLSHPSAELEKEYVIETSVNLPRSLSRDFERGVRIGDVFYRCVKAQEINARKMRVVLVEGKNREIRKVFEAYHTGIKSLERTRIGCVTSQGLLEGCFRDLTSRETRELLALCKNSGQKLLL